MPPRSFAAPPPSPPDPVSAGSGAAGTKAVLRLAARATRLGLKIAFPAAAEQAATRFPLHLLPPRPCVVALYHPIGSELDPTPLAARLRAEGAAIAAPVVAEKDAALVFRLYTDHALVPDLLGIHVPPPGAPEVRPDLVVVPLLAFDGGGARLGQGGGYYDRTLARLRAEGPVRVIGLAYAGQQVDAVPTDSFDQRLDGVLTEKAYLALPGEH